MQFVRDDSPAPGLARTFLALAKGRGFQLPADMKIEEFSALFIPDIRDFIGRRGVEFRQPPLVRLLSRERKKIHGEQLALPLAVREEPQGLSAPPQCIELRLVQGKCDITELPAPLVVPEVMLDNLTICFACFFLRAGAKGVHDVESLNAIRVLAAEGLRHMRYWVSEESTYATYERSQWASHPSWSCLARVDGVSRMVIERSVRLTQQALKAAS